MRLDKFLKVSRLVKRRTVANELAAAGRVTINGKVAKAGSRVQVGDVLEIRFGEEYTRVEVLHLQDHVRKEEAASLYKILHKDY